MTSAESDALISKIKSRGHWRIRFTPNNEKVEVIKPLHRCLEIVLASTVYLRGWDYPHTSNNPDDKYEIGTNYYGLGIDWKVHKEYWRLYQSAQFIHLVALSEDWRDEGGNYAQYYPYEPGSVLNAIGSFIFDLTEMFEFLSRLTAVGLYEKGADVTISLINTRERQLIIEDPRRSGFWGTHKAQLDTIDYSIILSPEKIVESPSGNAREAIGYIYERFGYDRYSDDQLRNIQQELYQIKGLEMK